MSLTRGLAAADGVFATVAKLQAADLRADLTVAVNDGSTIQFYETSLVNSGSAVGLTNGLFANPVSKVTSTFVAPYTGGGNLITDKRNQLRDGSTYNLPLAASVLDNQTIEIELPDTFKAFTPTVQRQGSDLIRNGDGTFTDFDFAAPIIISLTSNGVDEWSY